jgi:hypothetical protein
LAPPNPTALWLADRTVINQIVLAQSERAGNFLGAMGGRSPRADDVDRVPQAASVVVAGVLGLIRRRTIGAADRFAGAQSACLLRPFVILFFCVESTRQDGRMVVAGRRYSAP